LKIGICFGFGILEFGFSTIWILNFGFPIVLDFELWILDFFIDIILGENTVTRQKYLLTDETGRLRRLR